MRNATLDAAGSSSVRFRSLPSLPSVPAVDVSAYRISSTRFKTCRAAGDAEHATNAFAGGRDGPTVERTTNHCR